MSERKLRIGFVGGGWVCLNRHMPAAYAQPNVELVGLITTERNQKTIDMPRLAANFGLRHLGSSLDEAWVDQCDILVTSTDPDSHYAVNLAALERGKHVLSEKPFASTVAQCDALISAAAERNLKLGVIHNLQFCRAMMRARTLIASGRLGAVRGVIGFQTSNHKRRLPRWYKQLPLGLFTDESPHLIYMLLNALPGAEQKTIHVAPPMAVDDNTPQLVSTQFLSADGISGSLTMAFFGAISEWYLAIFCERGTAVIDFFRDILTVYPDDGRHETFEVMRTSASAVAGHVVGVAASGALRLRDQLDYGNNEVLRRFVNAVRHDQPLTDISGEHGRAVVAVQAAIHAAAGKAPSA